MNTSPRIGRSERGTALVEIALLLPFMLLLLLATMEFGHLIQSRLIITSVAREGGSIATRQDPLDPDLMSMLVASGRPLTLDGENGRIVITRVEAGRSAASPQPTITAQLERGGLGAMSRIQAGAPQLGLGSAIHQRLVFDPDQGGPDISQVTVVEVIYCYRPITPLPNLLSSVATPTKDGMIVRSKAVF